MAMTSKLPNCYEWPVGSRVRHCRLPTGQPKSVFGQSVVEGTLVCPREVVVTVEQRPEANAFIDMAKPLQGPLRQISRPNFEIESEKVSYFQQGADAA